MEDFFSWVRDIADKNSAFIDLFFPVIIFFPWASIPKNTRKGESRDFFFFFNCFNEDTKKDIFQNSGMGDVLFFPV